MLAAHGNEPVERNPWLRALIMLAVTIAAIYLFAQLWEIGARLAEPILILMFAWLIAFLLNPAVRALMRWRAMPRPAAVVVVFLGLLAAIALLGVLIVPPTVQQVADLGNEIPSWADRAPETIDRLQGWLDKRGIDVNLKEFYQSEEVKARLQEIGQTIAERAISAAQQVFVVLLYLVITLIIAFYLLLDGPRITDGLLRASPARFRDDLHYFLQTVDDTFGGYVRSWAILALIYGAGTGIIMVATDIPFVFPVAVFAGLMLVIPFVGDIVAVIPPLIIGLLTVSLRNVIIAMIALVALQQLVLQILRPKIQGDSVGLHPVLVLVAFLVGANVAGVWGAFFAVPIAGIVQSVVGLFYTRYVTIGDVAAEPTAEGSVPEIERTHPRPRSAKQ